MKGPSVKKQICLLLFLCCPILIAEAQAPVAQ